MDCDDFDSLLEDLEHDTPMPVGTRDQALQHAEGCAYCRARLAGARQLSLGLRALAKDDGNLKAPVHVEARLLTAFRQKERRPSRVAKSLAWASVAVVVAFGGWLLLEYPGRHSANGGPERIQTAAPAAAATAGSPGASLKGHEEFAGKRVPQRPRLVNPRAVAESGNDFIALPYGGSWYPVEEGMVVRVQVPRSAPALLGLPMSGGEDISGTVTADVVLGQDGVARAIRFVQPGDGKATGQNTSFQ